MVTIIEEAQRVKATSQPRSLFVEIIGPAGAGKSSLIQALEKSAPGIRAEDLPPVWKISYIPFFVKNILALVPMLSRLQGKGDRNLTRRELAWMAMLNGWPAILSKEACRDGNILLFDQGPIFLIAVLTQFGPTFLRSSSIQSWWDKVYARWMDTLDVVVWLDASDEILMQRIRHRQEDHLMKGESDQKLVDFLQVYRSVYGDVMKKLVMDNSKIHILRVDTGINSIDDVVIKVMSEIYSWKSAVS